MDLQPLQDSSGLSNRGSLRVLSIFVRNDGSPILSMISLVVMALVNIGMNYLTIFVWGRGIGCRGKLDHESRARHPRTLDPVRFSLPFF